MQPKKIRWGVTLLSGTGALLATIGATLAICWDDIFYAILGNELKLTPSSRGYPVWKETPFPMYLDFYLFNWTNPANFTDNSTKPNFVEMGPYRFRETREKVNITWNPENATVSYRLLKRWYFDEEGSRGSLDDEITTLNVIAASAIYTSRFWNAIRKKGVSIGLTIFHQNVFVTKSVRELLFEGYVDPLLDLANSLPATETKAPRVDRFGWFYKRNGSTDNDGYFNMATGEAGMDTFGVLMNWNHDSRTPFYPGECGEVRGSAGEFYPPKLSTSDKLTMFSPDLCRTISFDYDETVSVQNITAYKYSGGSSILDNGTINTENKCFCSGECQPSGTLNVSSCRFGSPAFISFPHFYLADPYYANAVEGMKPDKEKHNFYMALEPTSGIPLDVAARFQLNILVAPSSQVSLYKDVPRIFMPVLWFEQHVTLDKVFAAEIKTLLTVPLIGNIIAISIFVIGITIILWIPIKINIEACMRPKNNKKGVDSAETRVVLNNMVPKEVVCLLPNPQEGNPNREMSRVEEHHEPLNAINNLITEE